MEALRPLKAFYSEKVSGGKIDSYPLFSVVVSKRRIILSMNLDTLLLPNISTMFVYTSAAAAEWYMYRRDNHILASHPELELLSGSSNSSGYSTLMDYG